MSTLLERAKVLSEHMADLDQLAVRRTNFEKLKTRSKQLGDRANDLNDFVCSLSLLQKLNVIPGEVPPPSKELVAKSLKLQEEFALDWISVVGNEQIAGNFLNPVEAYGRKLRDFLLIIWRQYIDSAVPKINEGLLATLKTIFGAQVARLQGLRQELEELRASLPSDEKTFAELGRIATDINDIWQQLEGVPETVRAFLMKAAQRQATIYELTPDVRDWLENNSMLKQLRIGFA
jgi:hypothetical protein